MVYNKYVLIKIASKVNSDGIAIYTLTKFACQKSTVHIHIPHRVNIFQLQISNSIYS